MEDRRLRQELAQLLAALRVRFDDLHVHAGRQQLPGKIIAHPSAADQHDLPHPGLRHADLPEKPLRLLRTCHHGDPVPGLQLELTGGDDDVKLPPLHRADQHVGTELSDVLQRHAVQRGTRRHAGFENFHMPSGKGVDFDGRGEPQYPGHFRGAGFLRVDGHAEPQIVLDEVQFLHVHGVAHPGDGVPRAQLLADEAAQQVQLVRAGTGNDEVCLIRSGLQLNLPGSAVALHDHHVQLVVGLIQPDPGAVHQRHFMLFLRQLLSKDTADFSVADNHDFHKYHPRLYPFCLTISQIPIECNRAGKSVQNLKGGSIKSVIFCISFRKFTLILQKILAKLWLRNKTARKQKGEKMV